MAGQTMGRPWILTSDFKGHIYLGPESGDLCVTAKDDISVLESQIPTGI